MNYKEYEVTKQLAEFVESFDIVDLNKELIEQGKRVLIDFYCAAITGSQTNISNLVRNFILENEGTGTAKIIGREERLSKSNAAFINGTSAHCLDFDDGHTQGSIHPGAVVIPAVLAVSESTNITTRQLLKAIIVGYEVCLRVSSAIHPSSRIRGFHNTSIAGVFGATAAVSYIHGLNVKEIQNAFGIAGSFCGGIFAFLGTGAEVKRIHPGQAARDGITAAGLARSGLTGPLEVIEGENGFFQAFAGRDVRVEKILSNLGSEYEFLNIYFKPYPCCRHLHSAIDAIYFMKKEDSIEVDRIKNIKIGVNRVASLHHHKNCTSLLDAQMSMPFAISTALLNENLNIELFHPQHADKEFWELCEKVELYVDEEAESIYPEKRAARVNIMMSDGSNRTCFIDNPLGEHSKPLMNEQLNQKFFDNCVSIIGEQKASSFLKSISNILQEETSFLYDI